MKYSNPRLTAEIDDFPIGGGHRGKCVFKVEDGGKKGFRVSRTTVNRHGGWNNPKYSTYGGRAAIVDGEDGKTYIIRHVHHYDAIDIMRHDLMNALEGTVFHSSNPARYAELTALIEETNK